MIDNTLLVCHRWNEIILTTPSVWQRVSLGATTPTRLRRHIELSRTLDLHICAEWTAHDPSEVFVGALGYLLHHLDRWGSLCFDFKGLTPFRDFLEVSRYAYSASALVSQISSLTYM